MPFSFQIFSASAVGCMLNVELSFRDGMLGTLLLPVLGAAAILLLALAAARCRLPRAERGLCAVAARPETCTLQLWMLLLLYPSLAKTALTPFDCVVVGGHSLLRADPSVSCDGDEWRELALLGGIGTAVYSFGFPLLCFLVTRSARRARPPRRASGRRRQQRAERGGARAAAFALLSPGAP